MNTTNLLIRVEHHAGICEPEYLKKNNSIAIRSPITLKLEPRSDAYIDLILNIGFEQSPEFSNELHLPQLWLKPTTIFAEQGLYIADSETWIMSKTKHNAIGIHLLNKSHFYKIKIKKGDIIGFAVLLGDLIFRNIIMDYHII